MAPLTEWRWEEGLKLSIIVLGFLTTYLALGWRVFIKPWFQKAALWALKDQEADFRKWNDSLYTDWRGEQLVTDRRSVEVLALVSHTAQALSDHRREVGEALGVLKELNRSAEHVAHIAKALDELNLAVRSLGVQYNNHTVEIALVKQRQDDLARERAHQ